MTKGLKHFLILIILITILIIPYLVFAQTVMERLMDAGDMYGPYEPADDDTVLASMIGRIVNAIFGLLGVIFVILILMAGYNWMIAAGDEAKVTKAKDTIRRAIIGLIITVSAFAIYNFVFLNLILEGAR